MPNKTIYVNDEDLEAWNAIENKSRWISAALRGTPAKFNEIDKERKKIEDLVLPALKRMKPESEEECPRHHVERSLCAHQH